MRRQRPHKGKPLRRRPERPRECSFCKGRQEEVDYKDPKLLRRFISSRGKIEPRTRTGLCRRHQSKLALAVKRARYLALLPYTPSHMHELS